MRCPKCNTEMGRRTGRFGDFYYCSKSSPEDIHKTISVKVEPKPDIQILKLSSSFINFDLDAEIMRGVYSFGFANNHIGDLAQFSLGLPSEDYDDYWD